MYHALSAEGGTRDPPIFPIVGLVVARAGGRIRRGETVGNESTRRPMPRRTGLSVPAPFFCIGQRPRGGPFSPSDVESLLGPGVRTRSNFPVLPASGGSFGYRGDDTRRSTRSFA